MSRQALRVMGGLFIGCALLTGLAWKDSASRFTSVEQRLTIQKGQTASVAFTPTLQDAPYIVNLKFEDQQPFLDCSAIQASGIEWSIVRKRETVKFGNLEVPNQMKHLSCKQEGRVATIIFSISELALNQKHFLNLWVSDKQSRNIRLETVVVIFPFGTSVHYALIDLGLQELLAWGLLVIGSGCLLPDIYKLLSHRKPTKLDA